MPIFNLGPPFLQTACVYLAATRFPNLKHIFQYMGNIADDRNVDVDHLVYGGWVNVDMCLFRFRAEGIKAACDTVVKARTNVDHQITIMHGQVRLIKPVHAQHAQPVFP